MLFRDSIPERRGEVDLVPLDQVGQFVEKGSSLRRVQCPPGTVELEGSPGGGHDLVDIGLVALDLLHRADDLASRGRRAAFSIVTQLHFNEENFLEEQEEEQEEEGGRRRWEERGGVEGRNREKEEREER